MAKNFWEADKPADDGEFWKADAPADAPAPAAAPARASDQEIDQLAAAGAQPSTAAGQLTAAPMPQRSGSVLEGVYMPEPQFNPAEGERLSLRRNAEQQDIEAAQVNSPVARATPEGPAARPTGEGMIGRAGDLMKAQTYGAAAGLGRMAADAADAVGAEGVADNINARASAAAQKKAQLGQGVELEQAARRFETVAGFAPGSVVQDSRRFANEYLPQILAQGQQVPIALFGGLAPLVGISYLSSYADAREAGKSPTEAIAYAVPQASAEYIGERLGGMGQLSSAFEKAIASGFARDAAWRDLGRAFIAAGAKEVPSEELTYGLQFINDKFSPVGLTPNAGWEDFKRGAADTAIVAMGSGGMMAGAGAMLRPGDRPAGSAEAAGSLPASLDPKATADRIKFLRDAGEVNAADLLQKRLDTQQLGPMVERELASLQLDGTQSALFTNQYRMLRSEGVTPVEAAGRTAVLTDFRNTAAEVGMSEKAMAAVIEAAKKKGLDELPGFLNRYTKILADKGLIQPVEMGEQLTATRDRSIEAATASLLQPESPAAAQANPDAEQAVANIESLLDTGNDIAVTPELEAVHAAATSPLNNLPEPTQAQKDAGNYKVGRVRIAGMDISIENPQGSTRRGTDPDGNAWETPMRHHYGYFRGTDAADGDKLDVFVVPGTPQDYRGPVFVVDQIDPKTGALDEHKVILGARDEAEAEAIYRSNYTADWQGLGAITRLPLPAFKAWAANGNKKEALGDIETPRQAAQTGQAAASLPADQTPAAAGGTAGVRPGGVQPAGPTAERAAADQSDAVETPGSAEQQRAAFAAAEAKRKAKANRLRSLSYDRNPLMAFLGKHGVSLNQTRDFAPGETERRKAIVPGYGPVFRRSGLNLDLLAERAAEEGFLPPGSRDATAMAALVQRAMRGERVIPQYAEGAVESKMEAAQAASFRDFLEDQQDGDALAPDDFTDAELDESGYNDASPEIQAQVRALIEMAEAQGIDAESILEQVARTSENATQQEYYEAAQTAIQSAIDARQERRGDSRSPAGQQSQTPGPAQAPAEVAPPTDSGRELGDLERRAAAVYAGKLQDVAGKKVPKFLVEQLAEQAVNPGRYHAVVEDDNPKGLKIGDETNLGTVVSVRKTTAKSYPSGYMVRLIPNGEYGGWQDLGKVEKGAAAPQAQAKQAPAPRPENLIELRKRVSVLKSLRKCLEA